MELIMEFGYRCEIERELLLTPPEEEVMKEHCKNVWLRKFCQDAERIRRAKVLELIQQNKMPLCVASREEENRILRQVLLSRN